MNKQLVNLLSYAAILGNILFILWVSFNALDEGFRGTIPEKLSYICLVLLLVLNIELIYYKKRS